jgi:uncharacterized membrane protein YsdA (DUF1294 family)
MLFRDTLLAVACYAIAINTIGFLAFAWDKHRARNGMWRVPERTLLSIVAVGGTIGAVVCQRALRHKTMKEPFRTYLLLIALAQLVLLLALCFPQVREGLWILLSQTSR